MTTFSHVEWIFQIQENQCMLFHIGYHKTGTTWLQVHLFSNSTLGLAPVNRDFIRKRYIEPGAFEFDRKATVDELRSLANQIEKRGLTPVVSEEGLSGSPHGGGYNSKELADRIKGTCPQAKVLIVVREQQSAILSNYAQFISIGGRAKLSEYVQPPKRWQDRIPSFRWQRFQYHLLVEYYQSLFGPERVLVLPYEQFLLQPRQFVGQVARWCQVETDLCSLEQLPYDRKENAKRSTLGLASKRLLNFMYPMDTFHHLESSCLTNSLRTSFVNASAELIARLCPPLIDQIFEDKARRLLQEFCGDKFAESNSILAARAGVDLEYWGYELTSTRRNVNR